MDDSRISQPQEVQIGIQSVFGFLQTIKEMVERMEQLKTKAQRTRDSITSLTPDINNASYREEALMRLSELTWNYQVFAE